MADLETEQRAAGGFAGSPNPPPKAPEARGAASAAPAGGGAVVPTQDSEPAPEPSTVAQAAPAFRVYPGADGGREVWMLTPDLESTKLGTVNVSDEDAEKVLGALGTFNEVSGVWDVPEDAAQSLLKGRLGFTDNIIAKFKAGEANMARNAIGAAYLAGTMSREDAAARGHLELLKVQVGEQPQLAWNGLGDFGANVIKAFKNPMKALRFATGEAAEQVPILIGSIEAAVRGATKGAAAGGAAAAAALATGPVGAPVAAGAISGGAQVGAAYETWKFMSDTEAGATAMELLEMGFDDKTIKELAPLAGVIKGTLETASFGVMTAPLKRGFIATVLQKEGVKSALAKWYVTYAKTVGAEISTELAQTRVDQVARNYAAQIEAKPELLLNPEKAKDELWETFVKTAAATMLLGAPGAGVDLVLGKAGKPQVAPTGKAGDDAAPAPVSAAPGPMSPENRERLKGELAKPTLPAERARSVEALAARAVDTQGAPNTSSESADRDFPDVIRHFIAWGPDGKPIGALSVNAQVTDEAPVLEIAVSPEHRRKGVATKLYEQAKAAGVDVDSATGAHGLTAEGSAFARARAGLQGAEQEEHVEQLVEGFKAGEVGAEELLAAAEGATLEEELGAKKKGKPSLEERRQETARAARVKALEEELAGAKELADVISKARKQAEAAGKSTANFDKTLASLSGKEAGILQDIADAQRAPAAEAVAREEQLSLKAATLEDIVEAGFKEGRAEVIKGRAARVKEVAAQHGLSNADVKTLLKNKNIGLMGDVEFSNWMDTGKLDKKGKHVPSFRAQAADLAQRKAGRAAVGAILERKAIRKEQYIRAFHGLPAINKMSVEQLEEYVKLLGAYEKDDEALSPKRRKALETTPFKGAKTWRDVRERAAAILDVPMESLVGSTADQLDVFRYDSALAERSPVHKVLVEGVKVAELRAAAQFKAFKDKLFDLGAKAFASRERGFVNGRLFAPTMREVMNFLEAENEDKGKLAAALTPEELEFALFVQEAYARAYDYLVQTGDLKSSRFSDNRYFFHARRPVSEMVAGLAKGEKLTDLIKELLSKWKQDEVAFKVTDDTGKVLGLRKFFKQTLRRTGELTPSENVVRSTQRYFESFYKKVALDDMVPHLETLVMSLRSAAEVGEEEQQVRQASLERFTKHYLNAKKGHSILQSVIPQGGMVDGMIRLLSNYVSINAIALNIPLQLASKVGEQAPLIMALGTRGRALAFKRSLTEQGRAILAKYEHFTGESIFKQAFEPGRTIEDHVGVLLYGIIASNRASIMQTLLLGSMTDAEFKAGQISDERLAQIKTAAGRWVDVAGAKSIFGSTSTGAALRKFHGWAAPIMRTTIKDLDDIQASLRGKKTLTPEEKANILSDVRRAAESAAIVAAVYAAVQPDDEEDDSFLGKTRKYALRETATLIQAMDPVVWVTAGPVAGFAVQLAKNLTLLLTLAEYEKDTAEHDAGDLRGPPALKRQLTPVLVKQFQQKGEE